uniref:Uncharacterized protein n=1 Tax=Parascaris equorum TaxID=6256 RepID=A0A914RFQ1_PAREQ
MNFAVNSDSAVLEIKRENVRLSNIAGRTRNSVVRGGAVFPKYAGLCGWYGWDSQAETAATTVDLPTLDLIDIFGINYSPDPESFKLNNAKTTVASSYNAEKKTLRIEAKGLIDWKTLASVQLSWQHR